MQLTHIIKKLCNNHHHCPDVTPTEDFFSGRDILLLTLYRIAGTRQSLKKANWVLIHSVIVVTFSDNALLVVFLATLHPRPRPPAPHVCRPLERQAGENPKFGVRTVGCLPLHLCKPRQAPLRNEGKKHSGGVWGCREKQMRLRHKRRSLYASHGQRANPAGTRDG